MEIPLREARWRNLLLAVSLAMAAALIFQAGEIWLASDRLASGKLPLMERGAALVPGNAAAWDSLGRMRQWDLVNPDLSGAIADYQKRERRYGGITAG